MLIDIDPLLNGDLLKHLQDMGHGDVLAIVDRNFPAASTSNRLVTMSGTTVTAMAAAILTVLPVDTFVEPAVFRMGQVGNESELLKVHDDFQQILDAAIGAPVPMEPLERFEFYRRAAGAYLTVATSEDRPYACFLVGKGVV